MVSRSIIISLAIVALAHAMPADVVVPEDNAVSPAQSSLLENIGKITKEADKLTHSTHGSSTQVDVQSNQIGALKKQLAHVKESFEQTPSDGGAADLTSAKATAKEAITQAVTTMKTSVTGGFTTSKAAVVELEGAISTVERTIPTTELESIKVKSHEWCSSKIALDAATSEHAAAVIEFDNVAAPTLDPSLLAMSNFGPVTTCDLSVGESDACSTSWSCNLAQVVQNAISAARTTYHTAIWDKKNKKDTKTTASQANTGKQSSFLTAIETTIAAETAHCTGNDNIHASAVNAFNAVNMDRAAMYRQLSVVQCHVNHLDESDTSAVAVPEAATEGDTSTSAVDCVSKIKTKAQIKSSRFPDEALSGHANTCPTETAYMNQIKAYGHPDMNLSDEWTPGSTTCDNVASHGGSSNAFSYASNGATCSTECGQAGSDIVKYNCAKSDGTVVDTANCVGLTVPTDYTEACAATAACAPSYPTDPGNYHGLTGFVAFNWAHAGADFPDGADPLGETLGEGGCVAGSKICRGRIPTGVSPTHLLVKKDTGQWALWSIDGSAKAIAFLKMAQAHQTACSKANDGAWTPIASSGDGWGCGSSCNVLAYTDGTAANVCSPHNGYETNGWNYILDDDGHWCNPAFKMGATLNSGIANDYGFVNQGCGRKVGGSMLYLAPN